MMTTITLPKLAAKLGISVREMEKRLMAVGWSQMMNNAERLASSEAFDAGPERIKRHALNPVITEDQLTDAARNLLGLAPDHETLTHP